MLKLVGDEIRKLKRTWILAILPVMFLIAPLLGVFTVKTNSNNDPERILFDFATIFTQVQLDNGILVAPLTLGSFGIFLLQREYQETTLGPLLSLPIKRSDLLSAKILFVGIVGFIGSLLSAVVTIPMAILAGSTTLDWNHVVEGSARLLLGEMLTLPCVLLLMLAVVLFRNYLIAVSLAFVTIILGMVAINLSDASYFVPWLLPTILSVDSKAVESLGLTPSELTKAMASFTVFSAAAITALYVAFEKKVD